MAGPHGLRELVHALTSDWLSGITLDGYILYEPNAGSYPFKVLDASEVESGALPVSAEVVMHQRAMTRTLRFTEYEGQAREFKVFAGIERGVVTMRRVGIATRLNVAAWGTYDDMCSLYPPVILHAFDFVPLRQGGIPDKSYLGKLPFDRRGDGACDQIEKFPECDRQYIGLVDPAEMTLHGAQRVRIGPCT